MHCILEGLVQHHTHNLLGLTNKKTPPGSTSLPAFAHDFPTVNPNLNSSLSMTPKEIAQVSSINAVLVMPVPSPDDITAIDRSMKKLQDVLSCKNLHALQHICHSLKCIPTKMTRLYKADYVKALVHWVSRLICIHDVTLRLFQAMS